MQAFPPEVLDFLEQHHSTPVDQLALTNFNLSGFSRQEILQQLAGRQKGFRKFPFLQKFEQFKFAKRINIEQASSEVTSRFKADICEGQRFADLTGGMGMDTFWMGKKFEEVHYVEPNPVLNALTKWNFDILGAAHYKTHQQTAAEFLGANNLAFDMIFLDPSRRNSTSRVIAMEQYEPNLIELFPKLQKVSKRILVKFSPMQDLSEIKGRLPGLTQLWVLSVKHELKELLALFETDKTDCVELSIVNYQDEAFEELWSGQWKKHSTNINYSAPLNYIFEPAPGILKAGIQDQVATSFGLSKLNPNSQLYTSEKIQPDFPGRTFQFVAMESLQKKALEKWITGRQAHVIVRNFPMGAEAIKKKFKLKEQGDTYLIATTTEQNKKAILVTKRIT